MGVRFKTSRFHVHYGPDSLFKRVLYKFQEPKKLMLHGNHFNERKEQRKIPNDVIQSLLEFNPAQWRVVTVEVRNDTGKFVNATWEKDIDNHKYWVTIGYGNVVQTIIKKESKGLGNDIIKEGSFYQFVSKVNEMLMKQDTNL
ncbi:hypothetical protein V2I71_12570 [Peribacillus frigoritolerans]|uniref:hypothetical protein n=1 Tax=Peribacillus TaxID=2675229 RepID=UPI000BA7169D|nr:hypothetical protein [Peribacillus simplex]PAK33679.1 hypothetical protein CHI08_26165 [Peribacillus simplex]WVN13362.1 hypothetical protein V2I71_12570 [Peribacillus frigoritolerans]